MNIPRRVLVYIFCSALSIPGLAPKAGAQSRYDSLVSRGAELAYDAHFNEAESLFAEAARLSPERAESFFDVTQIHLWTYTFTQDRKAYNEFKKWYSIT